MRSPFAFQPALVLLCLLLVPGIASGGTGKKSKEESGWSPEAADIKATVASPNSLESLKSGGKFGIGLLLGSRTGLTMSLWAERRHSLSLDVGSTNFTNSVSVALSYHLHVKLFLAPNSGLSAQVYFGIGGRARLLFHSELVDPEDTESDTLISTAVVVGLRAPIGLSFLVRGFPIEVFIEAAPAIDLWRSFGLDLEGIAGARIYF
jgi:hypothetical protein